MPETENPDPLQRAAPEPTLVDLSALAPASLARLTGIAAARGLTPAGEALRILEDALAVGTDPRADAALLVERLGATFVAALTGSRSSAAPAGWAVADGPLPDGATTERLARGRRVWQEVSEVLGDVAARAWFLRHHRELGGDTPLIAVREGREDQLRQAVGQLTADPD